VAWLIVLAHENRRMAEEESARQTSMLMEEIEAHKRTDAALQKAKEAAEAANVAKTRYIVGISHEIRTPLNSIFGYAQLMERGTLSATENAIRIIRRSAEHLANLVDGLLDISRIENGMLRLNRDKVRLVEFLDQLVGMFRLQAAAKGIEFRHVRTPHLPALVHMDEKRLRQILINLLSNAIKYTEKGHATLAVRYRNQVAEFEVADSGMGIAADDLERIFEPFERGRSAGARAVPGTGLGLTISKLLTQIMGGEISVRSEPGQGTRFVVRLLLSEALQGATEAGAPRRTARGYAGARVKILVADDDPVHLSLIHDLLRPLGFELFVARDGPECLKLAAECKPDLVLLDISMPGMGGWQVAGALRALQGLSHTKIVMVSANAHEYTPGSAREQPHDAFVMKPVDIDLLLERIGALLSLRWVYEPPQPVSPEHTGELTRLPGHSRHHVEDLYQLGRIGHVRGIEAKLREIEAEDADTKAVTARLRMLIGNFDLKQYMAVVEGWKRDA
jgi:signal transduction histidine kinase/DNA-binding NarL/FixJ family response regulator